jgi:hypothetical protein
MNQYEEEINEKYICPICQSLFTDAKILTSCLHSFCSKCLESVMENDKSLHCALCRKEFGKKLIKENKELMKEINTKRIKCKCKSIVNMNEYEEHITSCSSFNALLSKNIKQSVVKDKIQ